MQTIKTYLVKYREQVSYLLFGALSTLLNFVLLNVFQALFGVSFAVGIGNALNNALCILFAYWTNRTFVFRSKSRGSAAGKEFFRFIAARLFTAVLDQGIMWVGVEAIGPRISFVSAAIWSNCIKLLSQVVVIVSNYIFSKWLIFKKRS